MTAHHQSRALIEMTGVSVASALSPDAALIEGLDWTVSAGDYWAVGGLPASGKSDLLSTAAGLQRPLRGTHSLLGDEISGLPEETLVEKRLCVGLVFENGGRLFSQLTVAENLALPICYHRGCSFAEADESIGKFLSGLELAEFRRQPASRLPRHLRQRVGLARALILAPEILLLDNPLAGLDPRQTRWWLDFLARLSRGHELCQGRPMTLVVTTDDLRPWKDQARQFALIKNKRWICLGGAGQLAAGQEPVLRELLETGFLHD